MLFFIIIVIVFKIKKEMPKLLEKSNTNSDLTNID